MFAGSPDWEAELADDAFEARLPATKHMHQPAGGGGGAGSGTGSGGIGPIRDTMVLTATIPADSPRFAVNVCPREHNGGEEVGKILLTLFSGHFEMGSRFFVRFYFFRTPLLDQHISL